MTDRSALRVTTVLMLSALPLWACNKSEQDESQRPSSAASAKASASTTGRPFTDSELADAVQQAAADLANPPAADSAAADGPPPNGLLGKERAQKEAALGSAPKLTLASNGSEPRVSLNPGPLVDKQPGQIEVAMRTGPRAALPTVVLRLEATPPKPAASLPAAGSAEAAANLFNLSVLEAGLGAQQPGQIPASTAEAIKKLKGTQFKAKLEGGALIGGFAFERAKAALPELDLLLAASADALTSIVTSVPSEPVGKGATWIVSSRETFMGTDVVAYRLFRVEETPSDGVIVSIDTKRYASGGALALPGIVDNELVQFEATDEAQFRLVPGQRLPVEGQLLQHLNAVLSSGGNQSPVQLEARALFAFPAIAKPAVAKP